jgi:hypothetical protein
MIFQAALMLVLLTGRVVGNDSASCSTEHRTNKSQPLTHALWLQQG